MKTHQEIVNENLSLWNDLIGQTNDQPEARGISIVLHAIYERLGVLIETVKNQ